MSPRRLLIFAYDYPPSLVGVRRTVKMIRYLREFGWRCAVVTVKPVCASGWDDAPLREVAAARPIVLRTGSLDPYRVCMVARHLAWPLMRRVYQGPSGRGEGTAIREQTGGGGARVMRFLRRAVLIPDDRVGWLPFAVATGLLAASRGRPDALYSTSYPHTAHVVAGIVHSLTSIPWIADFRDGWTQNPALYNPLTGAHAWLHRRLERWVARTANRVITVSPPITNHLQALRGERRAAAETIYNGFDDAGLGGRSDFDFSDELEPDPDEAGESAGDGFRRRPFHLLYGGTFFGTRSPETLFKALALVADRRDDFRAQAHLRLFTSLDPRWDYRIRELGIDKLIEVKPFVPFQEILMRQRQSDALVLVIDTGPGSEIIVTQKVFEYLASGRPIWALAARGACRDVLEQTGGAVIGDPENPDDAARALEQLFDAWRCGNPPKPDSILLARFHRREQAHRLAQILNQMIHERNTRD